MTGPGDGAGPSAISETNFKGQRGRRKRKRELQTESLQRTTFILHTVRESSKTTREKERDLCEMDMDDECAEG